jgi:hypothetical protein
MKKPKKTLLKPDWSLNKKINLTEQVLGLKENLYPPKGSIFQKVKDAGLQQALRRLIPLKKNAALEKKESDLKKGFLRFGTISKYIGYLPFTGNRLLRYSSRQIGAMVIRNHFWEIGLNSKRNIAAIVREYIKFAEGIGLVIDYDKSHIAENRAIIYISKCSAGVIRGYPSNTCRAMNEMDREVIRLLGGKLATECTLAENGVFCKFVITL